LAKAKLFDRSGNSGTVILNGTGDQVFEFDRLARAFHDTGRQAADRLINLEIGVDGWPLHDFLAYPVVFLYRHALELHMKAIILAGAPVFVLRKQPQIDRNVLFNDHSFERLGHDFERVFGEFRWSWDFGYDELRSIADFRDLLRQFQAVDARSVAFRYPQNMPRGFRVNVFRFADLLDPLLFALRGLPLAAEESLEVMYESRAEGMSDD